MEKPKKLIEVAMPIKEISAESVRDKSIRHGHISTLHLWWARRPLPVCRAVVFASLVPDPLDEKCPQSFKDAVDILLGKPNNQCDPYKPYADIPYTAASDKMEDNLRNRLLMLIGKFSEKFIANEKIGKNTDAKDQLSDFSLIKWDNKNNEEIVNIARKLIWVYHNSSSGFSAKILLDQFHSYYKAIKEAEKELYNETDRHLSSEKIRKKEDKLTKAINTFLDKMPKVFDPFAGGGAIPLEAARLGCRSYGNDINPVAYIIQKAGLEFPQKYGKQILYSISGFNNIYGDEELSKISNENKVINEGVVTGVRITNRLSFDIEYYAKLLLTETEKEIGHLYPTDASGKRPIAYYWARVGICSNPSCKAEIPLLRQFYLANTNNRHIYLKPIIINKKISFQIINGICNEDGWMKRANLRCPCCGALTHTEALKEQFKKKITKERMLAVIYDGNGGKEYRLPNTDDLKILESLPSVERPTERLPINDSQNLKITFWGFPSWGDMFTTRQIAFINTIISKLVNLKDKLIDFDNAYRIALLTYMAIWIDRIIARCSSFGLWHSGRETLEYPFGRQAIPMVFDFPESMPFERGSGSPLNQLEWILRYIESEGLNTFSSSLINASSGDKTQFPKKYISAVVTDPPYYDAIAYADLSDFFYVWLKRTLGEVFPLNFATPLTPKSEECTALKHHHNGNKEIAKKHFESKLTQIFEAIEFQTSDIVTIMFAHQSTEAWTTLCNAILTAKMNITGSWALDSEYSKSGLKSDKSYLSSSVTVSARPTIKKGIGEFKTVKKTIETTVGQEVNRLYKLGFRGADLLTACFGQAVSVFGRYERVEKADGSEVTVAELLEMAKESAFNALLKGFDGDEFTKFYIGWLQLFGFTESDFDDAAKFARVGLNINVSELFTHNLFIKNGNKQFLAGYKERLELNHKIGEDGHNFIIDFVHKAMSLYVGTNRNALLAYIAKVAASPDNSFWRVITSLCEILPHGSDDYKQASGLLLNKDSLIRESKNLQQFTETQGELF
ncbi:MAG: DUF1156 domain-containing protein [Bacteroidales bacterium]